MKRVAIHPQTGVVLNVEVVDDSTPITVRVPDDAYVGRGMIWNGSRDAPAFEHPAPPEEEAEG